MKITWSEKSTPYEATGKMVEKLAPYVDNYIVHLKTSILGESNELYVLETSYPEFNWIWDSDWYEGGEVELLGIIPVSDVKVPDLKDEG